MSAQIRSESIMHECMIRLLKSTSDEESLECFAKLMTTVGKDIDKEEAKVCECVCVYLCACDVTDNIHACVWSPVLTGPCTCTFSFMHQIMCH